MRAELKRRIAEALRMTSKKEIMRRDAENAKLKARIEELESENKKEMDNFWMRCIRKALVMEQETVNNIEKSDESGINKVTNCSSSELSHRTEVIEDIANFDIKTINIVNDQNKLQSSQGLAWSPGDPSSNIVTEFVQVLSGKAYMNITTPVHIKALATKLVSGNFFQ
ncbi:hypothetical protein RhiirA4_482239 [Rhizophagus irregularis]|uniref:Uncharacterized protein n=1 Tax=Rhizophagus irregularis TaxID=588596 RepID=A0A2I1HKS2_9GLOM|nr:hypothetical protein RhiirA4_482239 [Rhizophagus irregularis]